MPKGNTLSCLLIASLSAAALAAPAAVAQPMNAAHMDMHASTVTKPASAQQDLRSEAAANPSRPAGKDLRSEAAANPSRPAGKDLRSEATADPSRAPSNPGNSSYPGSFPAPPILPAPGSHVPAKNPGPPVWPTNPHPIASARAPVADSVDGGAGGVDLPVALLAIAGTLALGGGLTVAALKHRTRVAH
jgi:hypothetical protein